MDVLHTWEEAGGWSQTISGQPGREKKTHLSPNVKKRSWGVLKAPERPSDDPESRPAVPCNELVA